MLYGRSLVTAFCVVLFSEGGVVFNSCDETAILAHDGSSLTSYERLPSSRDPERRLQRLDQGDDAAICDVSALSGMPEEYSQVVAQYAQELLNAVEVMPLTRRRFYHSKQGGRTFFPLTSDPSFDRVSAIPIVLLPRPHAVESWAASSNAKALSGWRTAKQALAEPNRIYGRTVFFEAGSESQDPRATFALPYKTELNPEHFYGGEYFTKMGKIVDSPNYDQPDKLLAESSAPLLLGKENGAKVSGQLLTTLPFPENTRLRWTSLQEGSIQRQFLAYALVDGNGARRIVPTSLTSDGVSPFIRPLKCAGHQPRLRQHDLMLLPTPLGWPATAEAKKNGGVDITPHEDWCLDDWFPAQKDACWVIREAEDSKPLQESFLLMPASEKSDRPVFYIALFAETEPKQLIKELAALYNVSADKALNSSETMARLNSLYEKVRDFPLDK